MSKTKRGNNSGSVEIEAKPGKSSHPAPEGGTCLLQKILVPVDFSESSKKALRFALPFARQFGAELTLLYVVEIPYSTGDDIGTLNISKWIKEMHASGQTRLESLIAEFQAESFVREKSVREGIAFQEITDFARDNKIDLIIIATHGRSPLARVFMGSTSERVVRHAPCPVLVVRKKDA